MIPDFRAALLGRLVGISDRVIDTHVGIYEGHVRELEKIVSAYPRVSWTAPPGADTLPPGSVQRILDTPIADLALSIDRGRLGALLAILQAEVQAKGLTFWPAFYLGSDDFWTADRATSINLPWFLGADDVWSVVCQREIAYTDDDVLGILRHEYAHALLFAYEGWTRPSLRKVFGDFEAPYPETYEVDAARAADFVKHLSRPGPAQLLHYAQRHPDEDWAETFAVWLSGDWVKLYPEGTLAREKLNAVERAVTTGVFYGEPVVRILGHREPYQKIKGTVGEYVGAGARDFSMHAALLRREPEVFADVVLHENYFEALAGGGLEPTGEFLREAKSAFGSFDSWALDMRAIGGSTGGWGLACWDTRARRLRNFLVRGVGDGVPPGMEVLVALDCHEHAYVMDHGPGGKHLYLAAFFRNLDWGVVEGRLARARAQQRPGHRLGMVVPKGGSSCANCSFVSDDFRRCGSEYFQAWNGGPVLPAPADSYCCDDYSIAEGP